MKVAPKFSRLDADERRGQILSAARSVFAASGLAGASMADIAQAAGVTRGLLNHYFGTKRELYLAVVADVAAELPALVQPADPGRVPPDELVDANLTAWLDSIERNRDVLLAVLAAESVGGDPEVEALLGRSRGRVVERMAANWAGDAPISDELRLVLRAFLGAAEAAAREWSLHERASREQVHALLKAALPVFVGEVLPAVPRGRRPETDMQSETDLTTSTTGSTTDHQH